jgi:hypothetical protein
MLSESEFKSPIFFVEIIMPNAMNFRSIKVTNLNANFLIVFKCIDYSGIIKI